MLTCFFIIVKIIAYKRFNVFFHFKLFTILVLVIRIAVFLYQFEDCFTVSSELRLYYKTWKFGKNSRKIWNIRKNHWFMEISCHRKYSTL